MARPLTKTQLKTLKTMAMPLKPLLIIGKNNVTDAVVKQASGLLAQKELIKIQVLADTSEVTVKEAAEDLAGQLGATVVSAMGNRAVLFKRSSRKDIEHIKLRA